MHLSQYQYRQTQSCIEQWLSLYSVKSDFNWFALLHPDHKTVNDSGFLINWLSFFGCICCCFRQKIVAFAFPLYTIVKSMDISKKVLVIVGMYLKLYIAVTCLFFDCMEGLTFASNNCCSVTVCCCFYSILLRCFDNTV